MLYFDESGYTGPDLTNASQPYFTLASVRMANDEIVRLQKDIDFCNWGKELHFKNMYTNPQGRLMLNRIFEHPLMDANHVLLSFANKRYCIYANIVNILVETMYYHMGINIYEGAKNLILANVLYVFATLHSDENLINEFEKSFVKMVREPSVENTENFYTITNILISHNETSDSFSSALSEIPPTLQYVDEALSNNKFYIDLTIPLFSVSIQEWYKRTQTKENVLFDSSEPFYANKELLEQLRDMDVPETLVGYGEGKHVYPLPVGDMRTANSHDEFGIQLADVFASALMFVITPRKDKYTKYQSKLKNLPLFQEVKLNIAPCSREYIEKRIKETAEIDPVDFICEYGFK